MTLSAVEISGRSRQDLEELLKKLGLGLTPDEVQSVARLAERDPLLVECHIFNTMWSEHCSYKSSKRLLRALPTKAPQVVLGPGEDAGIVRVARDGDLSWCLVVSHESHNHPSQIVPNEGAATGIGGIVRDVYCMGADVVGVLDALRFGNPQGPMANRVKEIVVGVVDGIWQYGNALGVPNLGGDVVFDRCYDDNCLVNVVALGTVEEARIIRSRAPEAAKSSTMDIILIGKPTDESGFGGATLASDILDENSEQEGKGAVQVPDPFLKRVLAEATRALLEDLQREGVKIGFKDLGAGGICCATSEMVAATGIGAVIDLDKVPLGEPGLAPEAIACSETQERYVMIVPPAYTERILRIYNHDYDLPSVYHGARAAVIGHTVSRDSYVLRWRGEVVCDLPASAITSGIEVEREQAGERELPPEVQVQEVADLEEFIVEMMASVHLGSRLPLYSHYDCGVQGNTIIEPGRADASVIAPFPGMSTGIAVSVDGNPHLCAIDPYWGAAAAVAESMRNVASVGATPWALTDCLNMGNPEDPEVFRDFAEVVRGIGDAARDIWCRAFPRHPVPIVSGNVSFYNESSSGGAIAPSPIVACFGVLPDYSHAITARLKTPGAKLYLVGERLPELGGSEYLALTQGHRRGPVPRVQFEKERRDLFAVLELVDRGLVSACHDISSGGVVACLCEMSLCAYPEHVLGWAIAIEPEHMGTPRDSALFGEAGGFVIESRPGGEEEVERRLSESGAAWWQLGVVLGRPVLKIEAGEARCEIDLGELHERWERGLAEAIR